MNDLPARLAESLGAGFILQDELAGGGMSRVYLAREIALDRTVVVKVLAPDLAAAISVDRFTRETRLLASLQQANIVPILGAGTADGLPWFTMPFVEGRSLRERLADGALPIAEVQSLLRDVARALAYAHERGVVHRDIKPDNVLLSGGTAVVTDFGIAKALGTAAAAAPASATLTAAGSAIGTPAYMAPEQIAGDPDLDGRADLYALGCLAYELLTGRPPFPGLTPAQTFAAHLTTAPTPVADLRPDTPPALAAAVMLCLAKAPAARPASAQAFAQALEGAVPAAAPSSRRFLLGGAALLCTLAVVALLTGRSRAGTTMAAGSVVVLPFSNVGADSAHQYLADGITEELIEGLARVDRLRVVSRSLAFRYRGAGIDPRTVAREVDAATVLTGSVRGSGRDLHVVAELTRSDGTVAWSSSFDADTTGVAGIESRIIEATATQLQLALGTEARTSLTRKAQLDPEAHDLYLRGRFFWTQRSEDGLRRAIDFYRQSIDRAPDNTWALSGLADAYAVSAWYSYLSPEDGYGRAKTIAARALMLDSTLAEPNASLGYVALYYDWDWPGATRLFQRSITLDSSYATAHQWYGNYLVAMGRLPEAIAQLRTAERIDPANRISTAAVCWGLVMARRAREADGQCRRALELDSTLAVAHLWRGQALEALQDSTAAFAELETAVRVSRRSAVSVAGLAHAAAHFGRTDQARRLVAELESGTARYHPSYEIATVLGALGDRDRALQFLQRAVDERSHSVVLMRVDPALDPLRGDARLERIMRQVGLPNVDASQPLQDPTRRSPP